ncbi:MAG TPA: hypothetical protein DDW52_16175 [Planctomycetaceae bacterium]|nr:hypothetical protein [Planctomycetaceae bacterium]
MKMPVSLAIVTLFVCSLTNPARAQSRQIGGTYLSNSNFAWWSFLPPPKAFAYFDENDSGDSTVNAFLLSYLSDEVYPRSDETFNDDWIEDFADDLEDDGIELIDYESYAWTGTEVAIMELDDAMIVVFRGSHGGDSNAVNFFADWLTDINGTAIQRTIGSQSVYVHEGFWYASDSAYDDVLSYVSAAHAEGKKIWLTGHSLGGANATITAARLQWEDGIPVQGLHTFGSPRVGNQDFKKLFTDDAPGGIPALQDRTRRWVVEGDWATTLFQFYRQWRLQWSWWVMGFVPTYFDVHYYHVGQTNLIKDVGTNSFEIDYDIPSNRGMPANLSSLSQDGEHMQYTEGLAEEIARVLDSDSQQTQRNTLLNLDIR